MQQPRVVKFFAVVPAEPQYLAQHRGVVRRLYRVQHSLFAAEIYREDQRLYKVHKLVLKEGKRAVTPFYILLITSAANIIHNVESFVGLFEQFDVRRVELLPGQICHTFSHTPIGGVTERADIDSVREVQFEGEVQVFGAAASPFGVGNMVVEDRLGVLSKAGEVFEKQIPIYRMRKRLCGFKLLQVGDLLCLVRADVMKDAEEEYIFHLLPVEAAVQGQHGFKYVGGADAVVDEFIIDQRQYIFCYAES